MTQRTDKELLELAAKAASIECDEVGPFIEFQEWQSKFGMNIGGSFELVRRNWEPLSDDGDALRLAVKMRLKIDIRAAVITVEPYIFNQDAEATFEFFEDSEHERSIATRRAIVRAAAEIGAKL
jgi:hypothetical protein